MPQAQTPRPKSRSARKGPIAGNGGDLPYRVELWDEGKRNLDRILGRAHNAALARAIFKAACEEYPARRVTLRRAGRTIARNG